MIYLKIFTDISSLCNIYNIITIRNIYINLMISLISKIKKQLKIFIKKKKTIHHILINHLK